MCEKLSLKLELYFEAGECSDVEKSGMKEEDDQMQGE